MPGPEPEGGRSTLLFRMYRVFARIAGPLAYRKVARRLRDQGVDAGRLRERAGHATLPRPDGALVWFHAASVGESLSVLTLIDRLGDRLPGTSFLITSGTATSAALIEKRMPSRCRHQFAPLDSPAAAGRFLAHWRPRAGIFVESELWPVMLVQAREAGARLALLNARLSERSVRGWKRWPATARFILGQFDLILTQNQRVADDLLALGADPDRVRTGINLKSTSAPLPVDERVLEDLRAGLGDRPAWVASSTHRGEEQVVVEAHRALVASHPGLCLLLVPRHPERGDEVEALVRETGLRVARRSRGELPGPGTQVYLADTLGETGTWYALSPLVFLGGSLVQVGGHNPFEPAQAGAAVASGPHVANFAETYDPLVAAGGGVIVDAAGALVDTIAGWLDDPGALDAARKAAREFAASRRQALKGIVDDLVSSLALDGDDA